VEDTGDQAWGSAKKLVIRYEHQTKGVKMESIKVLMAIGLLIVFIPPAVMIGFTFFGIIYGLLTGKGGEA